MKNQGRRLVQPGNASESHTVSDVKHTPTRHEGSGEVEFTRCAMEHDRPCIHDELIARANAFVSQIAATSDSSISDVTPIDALVQSNLMSIVTPSNYGGSGSDWPTLLEVSRTLARKDASLGWLTALVGGHALIAARCGKEFCKRAFAGDDAHIFATASGVRDMTVESVPNGICLSGVWHYCSGVDHATWVLVNGELQLDSSDGKPVRSFALVPVAEVVVEKEHDLTGMRATGSKAIRLRDVFVPLDCISSLEQCFNARTPAVGLAGEGYLQRVPCVPYITSSVIAPLLGCAEGAVTLYLSDYRVTDVLSTNALLRSESELRCAQLLYESVVEMLHQAGQDERSLTETETLNLRRDRSFVARLCVDCVSRLIEALGTRAHLENTPMNQRWRDIQTMASHADVRWATAVRSRESYLVAGTA